MRFRKKRRIGGKKRRFLSVKLRKGKRRRRYRISRGGIMLG